jgi:hypothetical protein
VWEGAGQWEDGVSSIEDLIERRIRTIGVITTLMLNAWGHDMRLPEWAWEHEATLRMMWEASIGVAMWNDIYSLKKELAAMEMDNIVPLLVYHHDLSAQEAVDMALEMLAKSWEDFCAAESRLRDAVEGASADVKISVDLWVDACLDVLLGHVAWSLQVPRYRPRTALRGGAGFEVVL